MDVSDIMITYPISSNFYNVIGFTIFHFLEAVTRGVNYKSYLCKKVNKLNKHLPSVKVNLNSSFGGGPLV